MTYLLLTTLCVGVTLGWLTGGRFNIPTDVESAVFALMLFAIGLDLGRDKMIWRRILQAGWRMLLFPLNVLIGTLCGCLVANIILHGHITTTMAIGAGFGWYSLAAVLLNELDGARTAAIAFLANLLREILSFVLIPLVAKFRQGAVAVAIGGATTMDTTLPLLARATSPETAVFAFVSGVLVSALVPLLVPILYHL